MTNTLDTKKPGPTERRRNVRFGIHFGIGMVIYLVLVILTVTVGKAGSDTTRLAWALSLCVRLG
jgi:hypothetical protein